MRTGLPGPDPPGRTRSTDHVRYERHGEKATHLYASEADAQQHAPTGAGSDKARLFIVTAPGKDAVYLYGRNHGTMIEVVARSHGYRASKVGKPVAKEEVGAMLSRLSPEDRAVLIAQYVPAPKGSKK
jgi:hypothetical protein